MGGEIFLSRGILNADEAVQAAQELNVPVAVTGVTLNETFISMEDNSAETLVATVVPNNATNKSVTWSSSNTSVATVNSSGVVTAVSPGTTTIIATTVSGGKVAMCNFRVLAPGSVANSMIASGFHHTATLKPDGTVWVWGWNEYGVFGNGTMTDSTAPIMANINDVMTISTGNAHVAALKSDGTVWTWGLNNNGQVGTAPVYSCSLPVQVNNLNSVVAVAAGGLHTAALKSDGTVWTWGINTHGELGWCPELRGI